MRKKQFFNNVSKISTSSEISEVFIDELLGSGPVWVLIEISEVIGFGLLYSLVIMQKAFANLE